MPIKRYVGNDKFEVRFTSGKEIELTQEEIDEISGKTIDEVQEIKDNLKDLFNQYDKLDDDVMYYIDDLMTHIEMGTYIGEIPEDLDKIKDKYLDKMWNIVVAMKEIL